MMISFLMQGWVQALVTGMGIVAVVWLGTLCWRSRAVWLSPLRLPASADVTNRWLQALLGGLVVCAGVDFARELLTAAGLAGQSLASGEFWRTVFALVPPSLFLGLLVSLVRRERRRMDLQCPGPLPAWTNRVAAGLVFAAAVSALSILVPTENEPGLVIGNGEFLALVSLALWTGNRLWRAVALAVISAALLVAIPVSYVVYLAWFLDSKSLAFGPPTAGMLATYPLLTAVLQLLAWMGAAAGLATLLNPTVKAAFGLPPRGRLRGRPVVPPLKTAA
jgi:hypothetical protein